MEYEVWRIGHRRFAVRETASRKCRAICGTRTCAQGWADGANQALVQGKATRDEINASLKKWSSRLVGRPRKD